MSKGESGSSDYMANRIEVIVAADLTDGVCVFIRCTGTVRVRFCEGSELLAGIDCIADHMGFLTLARRRESEWRGGRPSAALHDDFL